MPEPKFVISVGSCSISGGVFQGCYNVGGSTDEIIPVDVYIPGCPPRPEAIVDGIIQLLTHLKDGNLQPSGTKKLTEEIPA
jgi:NADH:ubiquinone oxidoreductase subunit B-like Fe-S oxidoreductase